jgi:hypothetical protein
MQVQAIEYKEKIFFFGALRYYFDVIYMVNVLSNKWMMQNKALLVNFSGQLPFQR